MKPGAWLRSGSPARLLENWWISLHKSVSGPEWDAHVDGPTRRSLRWFLVDGVLASLSDNIFNIYQSVYLLLLGASRAELGLVGALNNLTLPLSMGLGTDLLGRVRRYKPMVIVPAVLGRLLLLGLIPLLIGAQTGASRWVWLGMALIVGRTLLLNVTYPSWTALVGDLVPDRWRGRYFSTRNIAIGIASGAALLAIGPLIDRLGPETGYPVSLVLTIGFGLAAAAAFSRLHEPACPPVPAQRGIGDWGRILRGQPRFVVFCLVSVLWNFSVQIAAPFFIPCLLERLGGSAATVSLLSAVNTLAALPGQRIFGTLNDRKGAGWVQRVTGWVIPLAPLAWSVIWQPWQIFPIELLSGFFWAGYNLASFNLLLELSPVEDRPAFAAFYQTVVGIGMAVGAALGGWLAQQFDYPMVFLVSTGGRWLAALLFAWVVAGRAPARAATPPGGAA